MYLWHTLSTNVANLLLLSKLNNFLVLSAGLQNDIVAVNRQLQPIKITHIVIKAIKKISTTE